MINLSMLNYQELKRLAEYHAHKESTDSESRAYILELLDRYRHLGTDHGQYQPIHNRIEGA